MKRAKSARKEQPTEGQLATLIPRVFHTPPTSSSGRSTQVLTSTIYGSIDTTRFPRATLINIPQSSYTAWWLLVAKRDITNRIGSPSFYTNENYHVPVQNTGGISIKPDFSKNYSVARQWASCVSVHSGTSTAGQLITGTLAAGVVSGILDVDWRSATDINTKSINKKNALIGIPLEDGIVQIQGHDINRNYRPITDIGTIQHGNGAAIPLGTYTQGQITIHNGSATAAQPDPITLGNINIEVSNWSFRARPIFYISTTTTRFGTGIDETTYDNGVPFLNARSLLGYDLGTTPPRPNGYDYSSPLNGIDTSISALATNAADLGTNIRFKLLALNQSIHSPQSNSRMRVLTTYAYCTDASPPVLTLTTITTDYHTSTLGGTDLIRHDTSHIVQDQNVTILAVQLQPPHDKSIDEDHTGFTGNVSGSTKIFLEIPDIYDKEITAPTHVIQWENVGQSQNIVVSGNQWIQAVSTPTQAQFTSTTETMGNTEPSETSLSELYDGPDPVFKLSHVGKQYTTLENKYKYHDDDSS